MGNSRMEEILSASVIIKLQPEAVIKAKAAYQAVLLLQLFADHTLLFYRTC